MRLRLFAFFAVLAMPLLSLAQPLSDRVPADALFYLGWQGSQSLGPEYDKSHTKAILDASNIPQVFNQMVPRLIFRVQRDNADLARVLQLAATVGGPLWRHPTAIFSTGLDWDAPDGPKPRIALVCRAENEADSLFARFKDLAAMPNGEVPLSVHRLGNDVVLSLGYAPDVNPLAGEGTPTKPINTADRFKQSLAKVHNQPVALAYADAEAFLGLMNKAIELTGDPQAQQMWPKVRDALGFNGLQSFIWTGAFDNADWSTQIFLAAPAPRAGLLNLLDCPAISDDMLRTVPSTATWLLAARFDPAKVIDELRTAATKLGPEAQQGFEQVMGLAQLMLAMNLQKDLLEPLGDQWTLYRDPASAGSGPLAATLVNRLDRPEDAQRAFTRFDLFVDNMINAQLSRRKMRVSFEQTRIGDLTVHYVATPLFAPAWAVKDSTLYVALYPQMVAAAAQPPAAGKSILDNPQFQAVRTHLGVQNASGLTFMDPADMVNQNYQKLLALSQLGLGALDMMGVKAPPMVIPPLSTIRPRLTPAGSASWTDDAGWHYKAFKPFPGAPLLTLLP